MRRVVVSEFVSIDGVFEDPGGSESYKYGGWSFDFSSKEYGAFKFDELMAADTLLLGRVTYQGFAKAWPTMKDTGEFGERMNSYPKYVVSKTLKKLDWNNSHLLEGDIAATVKKLKKQPGKDILVAGSGQLVRSLMRHGLVDEFRLMVHPIVLGTGKRLFDGASKTTLKLADIQRFSTGTTVLIYRSAAK